MNTIIEVHHYHHRDLNFESCILEKLDLIIHTQKKVIMSAITDLQDSVKNEDTAIAALAKAYTDLNTKLQNLPPDDSAALAALKADADAQTTAINAALNPVVVAPVDPAAGV